MSQPIVAFRTDAGSMVGLGHLRRCLTLALAVERLGGKCRFIINGDPAVATFLQNQGVVGRAVSNGDTKDLRETSCILADWRADACVIDSYKIPGEVMGHVRPMRVVVLDDLADRLLPVDIVVNGAPGAESLPYRTMPWTQQLLGPRYLLLRSEFAGAPNRSIKPRIENVLITVGGIDRWALTPKLVRCVRATLPETLLDVVVGPFFGRDVIRETEDIAAVDPLTVIQPDPTTIYKLMVKTDLAVTGGGQTTYELAASGTPAIAIRLVDNQTHNLHGLAIAGALEWVGNADDADLQSKLQASISRLTSNSAAREAMSQAGRALVDGQGASRVAQAILGICRN